MSTTRTFQDMLNDYLPNELLREELIKRDYLLTKIEKDNSWKGGPLIVPFKAAGASSVAFGSLTDSTDIAEDVYVRGEVSSQKEVWGSMSFNHRDLMEHDVVSEQNFLKILPGAIEDFMDYMKNVVSTNLLNGASFAKSIDNSADGGVADPTAAGLISVDRPDRCVIGMKVSLDDDNSTATTYYVTAINMNTKTLTLSATRGGAGADLAAAGYTTGQNAKLYHDGSQSNAFSDLKGALLSAANGGTTALYGQTKTAYPYLQAINVSGASITAANILEKIFDAFTTIRQLGKGNPTSVVMSYKNWASALKVIEASKGSYNVSPGSQKASQYGWSEIEIGSVKGVLSLVAVQEMDDDAIMFIDWRALKFHSNGFFRKRKSPDGVEYFETRATTGYKYIIDVCLFGEMVVIRPSYCGILHTISY